MHERYFILYTSEDRTPRVHERGDGLAAARGSIACIQPKPSDTSSLYFILHTLYQTLYFGHLHPAEDLGHLGRHVQVERVDAVEQVLVVYLAMGGSDGATTQQAVVLGGGKGLGGARAAGYIAVTGE